MFVVLTMPKSILESKLSAWASNKNDAIIIAKFDVVFLGNYIQFYSKYYIIIRISIT